MKKMLISAGFITFAVLFQPAIHAMDAEQQIAQITKDLADLKEKVSELKTQQATAPLKTCMKMIEKEIRIKTTINGEPANEFEKQAIEWVTTLEARRMAFLKKLYSTMAQYVEESHPTKEL